MVCAWFPVNKANISPQWATMASAALRIDLESTEWKYTVSRSLLLVIKIVTDTSHFFELFIIIES